MPGGVLPERLLIATKAPELLRSAAGPSVVLPHRTFEVVDHPLLLCLRLPEFAAQLST